MNSTTREQPQELRQFVGGLIIVLIGLVMMFSGCGGSDPVSSGDDSSALTEIANTSSMTAEDFSKDDWGQIHSEILLDYYPWLFGEGLSQTKYMGQEEAWEFLGAEFTERYDGLWPSMSEAKAFIETVQSPANPMLKFNDDIELAIEECWTLDEFAEATRDFHRKHVHDRTFVHQPEVLISSYEVHQQTEPLHGRDEAGLVVACDGLGATLGGPIGAAAASATSLVMMILSN
jgi:hypothetical protein